MRKIFFYLSFVIFSMTGCQKYDFKSTFSFEPAIPIQNEELTIKYLAEGTKLAEAKSIDATIYEYSIDLDKTTEVAMERSGKGWVSNFTPDSSTVGIILTFKDGDIIDNNNSLGYTISFNDKDGINLPEALGGFYAALSQWGSWYVDLKTDNTLTKTKFEGLFKKYPNIKNKYLKFYLYTLSRLRTDDALNKISGELSVLKDKNDLSKNDLSILAEYSSVLQNEEDTKKYERLISENYPNCDYAQEIESKKMLNSKSAIELKNAFDKFRVKHPNSELNAVSSYRVIRRFIDDDDIEGAIKTAKELKAISHPYAFIYATNKLVSKNDLQNALAMAQVGVESTKLNFNNPVLVQPKYLSKKDWDMEREQYFGEMLKIESSIFDKLDKLSDAFNSAQKSQDILKGNDVELNELYTSILIKLKKYDEVKEEIEKYLTNNKSNSKMLEYLETAYIKINGSKEGYQEYASRFSAVGKAKLIDELKGKIISEPAPDFELSDLNGNNVKFSDLKGKIVILDFWATWCGPCKKSFPAMQLANDKFKDNPNVVFLFVNTWERVDNKIENAKKFIRDNNYNLTVLMDVDNEVISKYKVTGIPTKFIIGPNQNIKFKSVGFEGTKEELVDELSEMIKLANNK